MSAISTLDTDVNSRGSSRVSSPSLVSSTPSSSSSDSSACQTPEPESVPDVDIVDNTFADSDPEDDKDGDYLPEISYSLPILRRVCRTMQQPQKSKKPAEPKLKRKAPRALVRLLLIILPLSFTMLCRSNQSVSTTSMIQTSFAGSEAVSMFPRQDSSVSNIVKRISLAASNAHNQIAERYLFAARR